MKIIFLNAWNGRVTDQITAYLKAQAPSTDIFCFQEAYDDMKALCAEVLPDFVAYGDYKFVTTDDDFPQVTYVRKGLDVESFGSVAKELPNCGLGIFVEVKHDGKSLLVCNFHGMSRPVDKLDCPERIAQSKALIEFFKGKKRVVIGGDFNIFPNTKSIQMFAENGYRDLIKEFGIKTTRNQLAWEMYPDNKQLYSDYAFITPDVGLRKFAVPNNSISDHLPMELEI